MNYLSHFYFDQHQTDAYYILGIALPDLTKAFNKSWNIHPHKNQDLWQTDTTLTQIHKGWQQHLAVDFHFHNSTFFEQETLIIKQAFRDAPFQSAFLRPSVLAHISLELVLDNLLQKDKHVDAEKFYHKLTTIDTQNMVLFMELNGITDAASCQTRYQAFVDSKYLLSYVHTERLAYALSRVCQRIWGEALPETDIKQLELILKNTSDRLHTNYMVIFEEISAKLHI